MKKLLPVLLALVLGLAGCGIAGSSDADPAATHVVATTYPVYLFASAVTSGIEGYYTEPMIDQPVSCLHDYTLTVRDMRILEGADVIVMNGAGLKEAMENALDSVADTPVIDCSRGIELLEGEAHHHEEEGDHEEHEEGDPHIWMDPALACVMIESIADGLSAQDPANAERFSANAQAAKERILTACEDLKVQLADLPCRELITFHDGFQYFARAFDLTILRAIEEEAGSEASAREVSAIVADIVSHDLPAVFTEINGSSATAEMIARECGVKVAALDLIMSRDQRNLTGIDDYLARLTENVNTIREAYT